MQSRKSARAARTAAAARRKKDGGSTGGLLRFILVLAVLSWALRSFVIAPFSIPSGSMLPTLYIGDYLIVAKWPFGYSRFSFPFGFPSFDGRVLGHLPDRGDVVVFRHPTEKTDLVKRVIGLPGDTIAVTGGRLVLNGKAIARQALSPNRIPVSANSPCRVVPPAVPTKVAVNGQAYCVYQDYRETLPNGTSYVVLDQVPNGQADDFGPVQVPAGHVFLLGDNRDDSLDSRYSALEGGVGMVPTENLIGRALVTFWSTNGSAAYYLPWTWFTALRWDRLGNLYSEARQ